MREDQDRTTDELGMQSRMRTRMLRVRLGRTNASEPGGTLLLLWTADGRRVVQEGGSAAAEQIHIARDLPISLFLYSFALLRIANSPCARLR